MVLRGGPLRKLLRFYRSSLQNWITSFLKIVRAILAVTTLWAVSIWSASFLYLFDHNFPRFLSLLKGRSQVGLFLPLRSGRVHADDRFCLLIGLFDIFYFYITDKLFVHFCAEIVWSVPMLLDLRRQSTLRIFLRLNSLRRHYCWPTINSFRRWRFNLARADA